MQFNSAEGWAACDACHAIIQRGDREGLAARSVVTYGAKYGSGVLPLTLPVARAVHDSFWANREGPPIPYRPT